MSPADDIACMLNVGGVDSAALAEVMLDYFDDACDDKCVYIPSNNAILQLSTIVSNTEYTILNCLCTRRTSCSTSPLADTHFILADLSTSVINEHSSTSILDNPVITDIDAAVEEASDTVCNTGLDYGFVL